VRYPPVLGRPGRGIWPESVREAARIKDLTLPPGVLAPAATGPAKRRGYSASVRSAEQFRLGRTGVTARPPQWRLTLVRGTASTAVVTVIV
jgi:hypothetical protein